MGLLITLSLINGAIVAGENGHSVTDVMKQAV